MEFLMKCLIFFQGQVSAGRGNCSFDEQNSCCFFLFFKLTFLVSLQQIFDTLKGDFQHLQLKTPLSLSFNSWKNGLGRALWRSFSCTTAPCLQDFAVQSIFELGNKAESLICSTLAGVWIKGRADKSFLGFVHAFAAGKEEIQAPREERD